MRGCATYHRSRLATASNVRGPLCDGENVAPTRRVLLCRCTFQLHQPFLVLGRKLRGMNDRAACVSLDSGEHPDPQQPKSSKSKLFKQGRDFFHRLPCEAHRAAEDVSLSMA